MQKLEGNLVGTKRDTVLLSNESKIDFEAVSFRKLSQFHSLSFLNKSEKEIVELFPNFLKAVAAKQTFGVVLE